jgi:hypothetical protein
MQPSPLEIAPAGSRLAVERASFLAVVNAGLTAACPRCAVQQEFTTANPGFAAICAICVQFYATDTRI